MELQEQSMLESTRRQARSAVILPMQYRAMATALPGTLPEKPEPGDLSGEAEAGELQARIQELQHELEEQQRRFAASLEETRAVAHEAGRAEASDEHAGRIGSAAEALHTALAEFGSVRDRYLAQVEQEVVRLALGIAARILQREVRMDPLLLAGAVRVALGQLADSTEVRLRVPAREHAMWEEMLRLMPNLPLRPEVVADEGLTAGGGVLETQTGSVDLGVRSQLAEIERGFFDLLETREQAAAAAHTGGAWSAANAETGDGTA